MNQDDLRLVYDLFPPKIDIGKFLKCDTKNNCTSFVLRGIICYYGRHYWAYFYSYKYDTWFQFDDSRITNTGSFQNVIDKLVISRAIPRTLFYERMDIIYNFLTGGSMKSEKDTNKLYFADSKIKTNNFWK